MNETPECIIIDIGSNTVKYDVFSASGNRVSRRSTYLGFINGIDENGKPSDEMIDKLCRILLGYTEDAKALGCNKSFIFATASFRSCKDPGYPVMKVLEKTGLEIKVLTWREEANLSFLGMLKCRPCAQSGIMADMGGASTELLLFENRKSVFSLSIPFGALSLKNKFCARNGIEKDSTSIFPEKPELESVSGFMCAYLEEKESDFPHKDTLYLIGGSAHAIGKLNALRGGGTELSVEELNNIYNEYVDMNEEKATLLKELLPDRYLIALPSIAAYLGICKRLCVKKLIICDSGIRDGAFEYEFGRNKGDI